ncbi:acyl transferase domain protein [Mycobacterium kansasii 662]|uniref:Acyl transferase domain protein n=1 Tax=Mycobacterium kansasii 662 TaxID=1299326 RepID=X7XN40_MYCKA|nr:acyl transferase domain protein [Mycobacterium kansasii 662]
MQLTLTQLWRSYGVQPDLVIGHSMGEVAAAVVAGALTPAEGLRVTATRSRADGAAVRAGWHGHARPGRRADRALIADYPQVTLGIYNSPRQTVIAGPTAQIDELIARVRAQNRFASRVNIEVAPHNPAMDALQPQMRSELADLTPRTPTIRSSPPPTRTWTPDRPSMPSTGPPTCVTRCGSSRRSPGPAPKPSSRSAHTAADPGHRRHAGSRTPGACDIREYRYAATRHRRHRHVPHQPLHRPGPPTADPASAGAAPRHPRHPVATHPPLDHRSGGRRTSDSQTRSRRPDRCAPRTARSTIGATNWPGRLARHRTPRRQTPHAGSWWQMPDCAPKCAAPPVRTLGWSSWPRRRWPQTAIRAHCWKRYATWITCSTHRRSATTRLTLPRPTGYSTRREGFPPR